MKVYTTKTKTGRNLLESANYNKGYYLSDVYGSYSSKKAEAWKECESRCAGENGKNFRIFSSCINFFCVAWEFEYEGALATHIITPSRDIVVVREEVSE